MAAFDQLPVKRGRRHEWERWLIRTGLSPDAGMGVSRTGLYTDFT